MDDNARVRVRVRVNPSGPPEWRTGIVATGKLWINFAEEICGCNE